MPGKSRKNRGGLRGVHEGSYTDKVRARGNSLYERKSSCTKKTSYAARLLAHRIAEDPAQDVRTSGLQNFLFYSRRPGNHFDSAYKDQPRRYRPVEFTKAKALYDPRAELLKSLLRDLTDPVERADTLISTSASVDARLFSNSECNEIAVRGECKTSAHYIMDTPLFCNSMQNDTVNQSIERKVDIFGKIPSELAPKIAGIGGFSTNMESSFEVELNKENHCETNDLTTANLALQNSAEPRELSTISKPEATFPFTIDYHGDSHLNTQFHVVNQATRNIVQKDPHVVVDKHKGIQLFDINLETTGHNPSIGKVLLDLNQDKIGVGFAKTHAGSISQIMEFYSTNLFTGHSTSKVNVKDFSTESDINYGSDDSDCYISKTNFDNMSLLPHKVVQMESASNGKASCDSSIDPACECLEEDYGFDQSPIEVKNVRLKGKTALYVGCTDLTSVAEDFVCVGQGDVEAYALANGVQEHCVDTFMDCISVPELALLSKNDSDVYVSDCSIGESDTTCGKEYVDEMEFVDSSILDFVTFSERLKARSYDALEGLSTQVSTIGKGKKKQLFLERLHCDETINGALSNQLTFRNSRRASKKANKMNLARDQAITNHDLKVKYPYKLHIKEIIMEVTELLNDSQRYSVRFPPLDSHGLNTLKLISTCFAMTFRTDGGKGKHQYATISKRRNSHKYRNDDFLATIRCGRQVFHRIDQRRSKEDLDSRGGRYCNKKIHPKIPKKSTTYKEGDLVGATAPHIGDNNIGLRLLIKLGWVPGEGLGAFGNKGISEPMIVKVKNSKEGLRVVPLSV